MQVNVGNLELIESRTIIRLNDEPIRVVLEDPIEGDYTFNFVFEEDSSDPQLRNNIHVDGRFELTLKFINYSRSREAGSSAPMPVGTLRKRELFLNHVVMSWAPQAKILIVNFLLGEQK